MNESNGDPVSLEQPTASAIETWLREHLAAQLGLDSAAMDGRERLHRYGLDSPRATMLLAGLTQFLRRPLSATLIWDHPTIDALVRFLTKGEDAGPAEPAPHAARESEPIAIVGMAARFPGAANIDDYWRLLVDGVDTIVDVPKQRWDIDRFYSSAPDAPGKMSTRWGGFLDQVDRFDAEFFGISPREAVHLDPQQRLALELAWEALEDAGIAPTTLRDTETGVFCGAMWHDYAQYVNGAAESISQFTATGQDLSVIAARISYFLGLRGPSMVVNTACSSALVAVHLACQSLRAGEAAMALAGGVNLTIAPESTIAMSHFGAMAPDGRSKAFDARANGYVRGEGGGIVVLKPLSRAIADGDPIYCVIRGSSVNNDGFSNGLTAPNPQAQVAMLRSAYRRAGVRPDRVHFVETHGTGTILGDPIEANAIGAVLGAGRTADRPLLLGSVKTNIGHLEAAAGIAGLIKTVLAMKNQTVPPNLHFERPSPHVSFDQFHLRVPRAAQPWPCPDEAPLAGVSAFGFGGTNCHVVLEALEPRPTHVLPLSAPDPDALREMARSVRDVVADSSALPDLCYTASRRLSHGQCRLALTARTPGEAAARLDEFLDTEPAWTDASSAPGVVFVFPGQGGQWLGMGRGLLCREPVFARVVRDCAVVFGEFVEWSLVDVLEGGVVPAGVDWEGIDVVQPVLFAVEVGLAALWRSWGVEPVAVVGHSMGEVAAAYVAGVLSLADAARVICVRSGLLREVSGGGAMAVVELSADAAERVVAGCAGVVVAALNGPTTTVLAGAGGVLEGVVEGLVARGVFARLVRVDVASHSPAVDPLRDVLLERLVGIKPGVGSIPVYSTVRGEVLAGPEMDAGYWADNLRLPVRFAPMIDRLLTDGLGCLLEISPHPVLSTAMQQACHGRNGTVLTSLRRDTDERLTMLDTAGALYSLGVPVDWDALSPAPGRVVRLPTYPWQRERFWLDGHARPVRRAAGHPLLGEHVESSLTPGTHLWTTDLGVDHLPYLDDHRVRGQRIVPAAAYVEMALSAATDLLGTQAHTIERLDFTRPLVLPDDHPQPVQVALTADDAGTLAFQCASRAPDANGQPTGWLTHATGTVTRPTDADHVPAPHTGSAGLRQRLTAQTGDEHYLRMRARGLSYGPAFRGVRRVWREEGQVREGEALAQIRLSPDPADACGMHPALLDSCFQVAIAAIGDTADTTDTVVPIGIERLEVRERPGTRLWCHARTRPAGDGGHTADLLLLDDTDRVLVRVTGLILRRMEQPQPGDLRYEIDWQPIEPRMPPVDTEWLDRWLVFAEHGSPLPAALRSRGGSCVTVRPGGGYQRLGPDEYRIDPQRPEHVVTLLADAFPPNQPCRGIIHRWALETLETADADPFERGYRLACDSVVHLVQGLDKANWAHRPRLWLVTKGAQAARPGDPAPSPVQAQLWGLGRTIQHEHPDLGCTCVDLGADLPDADRALLDALAIPADEPDLALRGDGVLVARLVRGDPDARTSHPEPKPAGERPFRLDLDRAGTLDDLCLRAFQPTRPGPGQVLIEVHAAALNFRDVLKTLGTYPGPDGAPTALGDECAGVVVAIGPGVTKVRVGDEVVAVAPHSLATQVVADARLVAPKPARTGFAEAATIPIAFLTAAYALEHLGRMAEGERVLVHAAAGGVGLAAVQLAQAAGAQVFATAGSEEKRAYLRSLGVWHVMDSRSLDFADQVLAATGGVGVDLVLNSLAGEFIPRGIATLAPHGRFLEIGKRDVYQDRRVGLKALHRNAAFFAIDLDRMFTDRPEVIGGLLHRIIDRVEHGQLRPLRAQQVGIGQVGEALHEMQRGRHIGKLVISMAGRQAVAVAAAPTLVRSDASYLITGGFGGLGRGVADWLASQGARHVVLVGRGGAPEQARPQLEALTRAGVKVTALAADVARPEDVAAVLAHIGQHLPPLRGIVHAAGVLDDGILLQMTPQRLRAVARPKVEGSWHLHTQTLGAELDFFVLFSSVTSVLGSPGQAGYAAANAAMDALAHARRAAGLPALSINWGPWSQVGMVARMERGGRQALRGLRSITPEQGVSELSTLIRAGSTQVAVMPFDAAEWTAAYPGGGQTNLLALVRADQQGDREPGDIRGALLATEPGRRRRAALETYLREQAARVLRTAPTRVGAATPLRSLGLDSLMSLELRNRLEAVLGLTLPSSLIWNYPTVEALIPHLAERMRISLDAADPKPVGDPAEPVPDVEAAALELAGEGELSGLSVDDLEALLLDELEDPSVPDGGSRAT